MLLSVPLRPRLDKRRRSSELLDRVVADLDHVLSADALAAMTEAEKLDVLRVAGNAFRRVEAIIVETVARWPALREAMREGSIGIAGLLAATGPIEQAGEAHATKITRDIRGGLSGSSTETR